MQKQLAVSTQNGSVYVQDLDKGRRRGTLEEYKKITKLCQESKVVKVVGGIPAEPIDVEPGERHLKLMYTLLKHTDKPLLGVNGSSKEIREMFDMIEIAMGQKDYLLDHPMIAVAVDPTSPLRYDSEPCETMIAYAKHGQPIYINSCSLAGATGPISLLGTTTLMNAEILAGLTLIQLINPGNPFVYVSGSTVADMKTANFITGSPEGYLIVIAGLQMALDLYCIPSRAMAATTDAKIPDCQAGFETMQNLFMCLLAGVHFINCSLGCLDAIMTTSYEKFVIDEEMINRVVRVTRGISSFDNDTFVDVIQDVGHSGCYLTHPSTFKHFRERWQPTVSYWNTYEKWVEAGSEDVVVRANRRFKEMLDDSPETMIDKELENDLLHYMKKVKQYV
jgi:trimethylamine--corrinoid protein Co-methyltransferase